MMTEEAFIERLKWFRRVRGVSAKTLSLAIGQSNSYICRVENGKACLSVKHFFLICEQLNIAPSEFLAPEMGYVSRLSYILGRAKSLPEEDVELLEAFVERLIKR